MNIPQRNKRAMMTIVNHVFTKNQSIITTPALQQAVAEFQENLAKIDETILIQEGNAKGTTKDKMKEEKEMVDAAIRIGAGIYVWALDNSNFDAMERVNFSPSSLANQPDIKLISDCSTILKLARQHTADLADYGISSEEIDGFEKEINDFKDIFGNPRSGIVTRSQATSMLSGLISEQMSLLNLKLDRLVLMLKDVQPVFYNEYKSARIIVNIGSRHKVETEEDVE